MSSTMAESALLTVITVVLGCHLLKADLAGKHDGVINGMRRAISKF